MSEVIESPAHFGDVLASVGADDHLLVGLDAALETLRKRIVAREPPGWSGLPYLLDYTERLRVSLAELDNAHLLFDSERLAPEEIADRIRSARPDKLEPGGAAVSRS